jgi:hypothetical protein
MTQRWQCDAVSPSLLLLLLLLLLPPPRLGVRAVQPRS